MRNLSGLLIVLLVLLVGCGANPTPSAPVATPAPETVNTVACAPNAIEIDLIFALNPQQNYMTPAIDNFNGAYAEGRDPVTGEALAADDPRICVLGRLGSSSRTSQAITNAIIAPDNDQVARPVLYAPSVSHWVSLANYRSGVAVFPPENVRPLALTPIVMAIWESRLQAIRETTGSDEIGWAELLDVLNSPNGWADYGIEDGRRAIYYGHTDPRSSSTGLSALIAEFYASARANGFTGRRLTLDEVNDEAVQQGVRDIEQLIRHYSTRTDDYLDYIAQGTDYVDLVALEEIDLMYINGAFSEAGFTPPFSPPEQMVALYPREGTIWHERPIAIVNAEWVTPEQTAAARQFVDYLLSPEVQRDVTARGFRPANPDVALGDPFITEFGVTPEGPATVFDMPDPETLVAIQQSWSVVKKRADVLLLVDVSGSMGDDDKIGQARAAARLFVEQMDSSNRLALATFSTRVNVLHELELLEGNKEDIYTLIDGLEADGGTELYLAVRDTVERMNDVDEGERIRAVVVLSDGADTGEQGVTLNEAVQAIAASRDSVNPVIVVPLAYGVDADMVALSDIARASATRVQSGNPSNIEDVLRVIQSFF